MSLYHRNRPYLGDRPLLPPTPPAPVAREQIHAQNCHCPRCAPWRRHTGLNGYRAIWHAAEPDDRAAVILGLIGALAMSAVVLTVHFWPAIVAALSF